MDRLDHEGLGLRPILVVALIFGVAVGVPLLVDLWHFGKREVAYRKFKRTFNGEYDQHLSQDWTSSRTADLSQRLMRQRDLR